MILFIILLVLFILVMGVWAMALAGAIAAKAEWLAFCACLLLGIVVFLTGTGTLAWPR